MKFFALGPGAAHPAAPADLNLRPWAAAPIKNALNQPLFCCSGWRGSNDKNRYQIFRHFPRHTPGPAGAKKEQAKDRASKNGSSEPPP